MTSIPHGDLPSSSRSDSTRPRPGHSDPGTRVGRVFATLVALAACLAAPEPVESQLRYEREYPTIQYTDGPADDPVADLWTRVERGEVELRHTSDRGYLDDLLAELDISPTSQTLVFTRTSFQGSRISPERPRAIYFNDDTYVAFVQDGDVIEISAVDPVKGGVFYTLEQSATRPGTFQPETDLCLQCHDSYGLTGGGAPRYLVGSMLSDENGQTVSHEGWQLTDDRTPFSRRWGGWYVTGTHGDLTHRGNVIVEAPATPADIDFAATGNRVDLSDLLDVTPYPSAHSDIVALMVLEHQVRAQNAITRLGYDVRTALAEAGLDGDVAPEDAGPDVMEVLERSGEPLVEALLFVDEAPLGDRVEGTSGFAEHFTESGVRDGRGRSLRDFDLEHRLFRHPLSYMIRSRSFVELPRVARAYVHGRVLEVLEGRDGSDRFEHLTPTDREATLEIARETVPELFLVR